MYHKFLNQNYEKLLIIEISRTSWFLSKTPFLCIKLMVCTFSRPLTWATISILLKEGANTRKDYGENFNYIDTK